MLCIQSVFISIITLSINTEKTILNIFCDVIKQSDKVKKKKTASRTHGNCEKGKKKSTCSGSSAVG